MPVSGMGTWERTLQPRDINNDGTVDAFYDTVLNISWLADGNAGAGSGFDASYGGGLMTWPEAKDWAANLNVFGLTGWRLPVMVDTGTAGCNFAFGGTDCGYNLLTVSGDGKTVYSELAHLFYVALGNLAGCDSTGDCTSGNASSSPGYMLLNTGNFRDLQAVYWAGLPYSLRPDDASWYFANASGDQDWGYQQEGLPVLAVRPGDVTATNQVPEPHIASLAAAALGAMLAARGRRRSKRTPSP